MTKVKNEFKDAEALGHVKPLPENLELSQLPEVKESKEEVINDPEEFRMAIAHAQMEGVGHVIVSKKMLEFLMRGNKGVSLTYGSPGVRVYLEGTKESLDDLEKLSAEQFHEEYIKQMRGEKLERLRK